MENSRKQMKRLFLFLALGLAGLSDVSAQEALSGTVTDAAGAKLKNAKVILLGRGDSVFTDANGMYRFTGTTSLGANAVARENIPAVAGSSLRFGIRGGAQRVGSFLFSLSGRLIHEVADVRLANGNHRVSPFRSDASPLSKTSAVLDTLSVIAVGFERGERMVEALTGTQDFKLNALKWTNVVYRPAGQPACGQCILDVRKPASGSRWPVLIHFHGGGMTGGDRTEPFTDPQYRQFGQKYLDHGYMVVMPGYTLAGGGSTVWPQYIRDAVQASIWVRKNIEAYGGDPNSVFVTGFSAGAYLTNMMAIDSTWFAEAGFNPRKFAGFISMSGQTRTHDNIRADLKVTDIMKERPDAMPMGHIRKTTIPWQVTVGGLEGATIASNQDMYDALIKAGSTDLHFDIIPDQPHTCADIADANSPKRDKLFAFIDKYKAK